MPTLSIGDLARETGAKVETIRYYERIGLLPTPARTRGGQRAYAPDHLHRLGFVRRARELGFGLDEVDRKLAGLCALRRELGILLDRCGQGGRVAECRIIGALSPGRC